MTLIGLDGNITSNVATYENQAFNLSIKDIGTQVYRVFGSWMNFVHWRNDKSTPDNVKLMHNIVGCKLIWGVNMITKPLRNMISMFEYIKSINLPCDYFECANEVNRLGSEGRAFFETADDYSLACKDYAAAIKSIFPDAIQLCTGENRPDAWKDDLKNWNERVLANNPDAHLVWHHHTMVQYVFDGHPDPQIILNSIDDAFNYAFTGFPANKVCVTEFSLAQGQSDLKESPIFRTDDDKKLAIKTLMQGLVAKGVELATFHNVVGAQDFGAITSSRFGTWLEATGLEMKEFIPSQI